MGEIAAGEIAEFFRTLAQRYRKPASVFLLGASALALLGSLRPTLDIDYDVKGTPEDMAELQKVIEKLAAEQKLELEYVPIEEFIPLPESAASRHRLVGRFGELTGYVYDPYSIALSKVAR